VFDTSALVYIYQHSDKSDAHTLLMKYRNELNQKFLLAKNDLHKDLPEPLRQKYGVRMSTLFSMEESPRDELFDQIKQTAVQKGCISKVDIQNDKLTDLDIVRLAKEYANKGEKVLLISDDEGVHKTVKEMGWEQEIDMLYTHLYFMKFIGYTKDTSDQQAVYNNIQDSYYYTKMHLAKSDRVLPYDKILNTSLEIVTKNYLQGQDKRHEQLIGQIGNYLEKGVEKSDIADFMPVLKIMRKKRAVHDYSTYQASLDLMMGMKKLVVSNPEKCQLITELVHQELATYHLELAYKEHKNLNLVGALTNIRATTQSLIFVNDSSQELAKSLEELLFIEALLLLELGSETEALSNLEQFVGMEKSTIKESRLYQDTANALLIIFDKKVGRLKEESTRMLLELVEEALMIPNTGLAIKILARILEDESVGLVNRKHAAKEIVHLVNLRFLLVENPLVEKASKILDKAIEDRTKVEADSFVLQKIKTNFQGKEAEAYRGPWEIADIRHKKQSYWIYAWNERLKSLWVLDIKGNYPQELDKAKKITFLSGEILDYKKPMSNEDVKFRQRIVLNENPVFVLDEKRALTIW